MITRRIYIINPNSLTVVTQAIDQAIDRLRFADGPQIRCVTLAEGPPGIQSQRDVDAVVTPLCRMIEHCSTESEREGVEVVAFIIACFSDPGLYAARECTDKPVWGIAQCAALTAMAMGERFGVISILRASLDRHWRYFAAMDVTGRLAADLPIELDVKALADQQETFARLCAVGSVLRDENRADVLVLGCAGMAAYREKLEQALGVIVIDPCQAAVAMALGRIASR